MIKYDWWVWDDDHESCFICDKCCYGAITSSVSLDGDRLCMGLFLSNVWITDCYYDSYYWYCWGLIVI